MILAQFSSGRMNKDSQMSFHVCSDKLIGESLNAKVWVVGQSLGGLVHWLVHWFDRILVGYVAGGMGKTESELETA